jgi:hypothetical protein
MKHQGQTLNVKVDLHLDEYKQIARDFIPVHYAQKDRSPNPYYPWNWPIVEKALFAVFVPLLFRWKKSKVGVCKFTFSEVGLTRHSEVGEASRGWEEILEVHELSTAYLIQLKAGGAMPVPYRVFTPEQRSQFESFAANAAA